MAGKTKDTGIHVQEACDTWLSTENRHKVVPKPCVKQSRKRHSSPRVFKPLNTSLLEFNFTQTKSVVATKQTNITAFFKGTNRQGEAGIESDVISVSSSSQDTEELPHYISLQPRASENNTLVHAENGTSENCKENAKSSQRLDSYDETSPKEQNTSDSLNSDLSCESVKVLSPSKTGGTSTNTSSNKKQEKKLDVQRSPLIIGSKSPLKSKTTSFRYSNQKRDVVECWDNSSPPSNSSDNHLHDYEDSLKSKNLPPVEFGLKENANSLKKESSIRSDQHNNSDKSLDVSEECDSDTNSSNNSNSNYTGNDQISQNSNHSFTINTDLENEEQISQNSNHSFTINTDLEHKEQISPNSNHSFTVNTDLENNCKGEICQKDSNHSFTINTNLENNDVVKFTNCPKTGFFKTNKPKLKTKSIYDSDFDTVLDFSEAQNVKKLTTNGSKRKNNVKYIVEKDEITDSFWSLGSLDSCNEGSDDAESSQRERNYLVDRLKLASVSSKSAQKSQFCEKTDRSLDSKDGKCLVDSSKLASSSSTSVRKSQFCEKTDRSVCSKSLFDSKSLFETSKNGEIITSKDTVYSKCDEFGDQNSKFCERKRENVRIDNIDDAKNNVNLNKFDKSAISLSVQKDISEINHGDREETILKRRLKSAHYGSRSKRKRENFSDFCGFDTEFDNCDNRKRYRANQSGEITDSFFTLTD